MTHHRFVLSDGLWRRRPHCYRVGPRMVAFIQNWGYANPIAARPTSHACGGMMKGPPRVASELPMG